VNVIEGTGKYWKVQCSGIGPITRVTDVPGGSRGAGLTWCFVTVNEEENMRLIDYLRWAELHI
jgi:hypothetical protein